MLLLPEHMHTDFQMELHNVTFTTISIFLLTKAEGKTLALKESIYKSYKRLILAKFVMLEQLYSLAIRGS